MRYIVGFIVDSQEYIGTLLTAYYLIDAWRGLQNLKIVWQCESFQCGTPLQPGLVAKMTRVTESTRIIRDHNDYISSPFDQMKT
jgi:hypothetical protein